MSKVEREMEGGDDREARVYELGFHIVPTVGDEGLGQEVEALHAILSKHHCAIISEEQPQLMRLAYPLERVIARAHKKFDSAYFGWVICEAFPEDAHALKEALLANEHIIRFLLIKTEKDVAPVRHPAQAPRFETKPVDATSRVQEKPVREISTEEPVTPMTTEQMDVEIEKLVV